MQRIPGLPALARIALIACGAFAVSWAVVRLMQRLAEEKEFPHEIGLFLSYPPEDVKGFIENKASNSKCVGTWKVYGNVDRAKALFAQFQRCTDIYCKLWQAGSSLEELAVAV